MYHVVDELEKRSMPLDLALLPMINAYNLKAYSPALCIRYPGSSFPPTGKLRPGADLVVHDGPARDVLAATEAALDYLNYLYGLFW